MGHEQLKGHLDLLLLAVVEAGPVHGYGVVSMLRRRSCGEFDLPEGTIYPALHRLEAAGLLTSIWEAPAGQRRRRVYSLSAPGIVALARSREQWESFAIGMSSVVWGLA